MGILHRFVGREESFEWEGVPVERYDAGGAVGGTKRVLIGSRDGARNFSLRYYEIAPGGRTSYDTHEHDHGVYVLRGKARVSMGSEVVDILVGDAVYIPPDEEHQFENTGAEPFGFLCAVPPRD